jgi:hypothetical protein
MVLVGRRPDCARNRRGVDIHMTRRVTVASNNSRSLGKPMRQRDRQGRLQEMERFEGGNTPWTRQRAPPRA